MAWRRGVGQAIGCIVLVTLLLGGCSSASINRDVFGATQEALAAFRQAEPGLIDHDALHDAAQSATGGASDGLRLTPELQADANRLAGQLVSGAMAALAPAIQRILELLRAQVGLLLDDVDSPLVRLTHDEMVLLRRELRGALDDLDVSLQRLIQHNARVLADELRTSVGPALDATVVSTLSQGSREVGTNLTASIGRGVRRDITPALRDASGALLGQQDTSSRRDWILGMGLGAAVLLIGFSLVQTFRNNQRMHEYNHRMYEQSQRMYELLAARNARNDADGEPRT